MLKWRSFGTIPLFRGVFCVRSCHFATSSSSKATNPHRAIKQIISKNKRYEHGADDKRQIVNRIFAIYHSRPQNVMDNFDFMVNDMLRACLLFNHCHRVFDKSFWADIERQILKPKNRINAILLLKCCMESNEYRRGLTIISILSLSISSDPYIQSTLIDFHGHFGDVLTAKLIFDGVVSSRSANPDSVFIGAMMKALISNDHIEEALRVYDDANTCSLSNSVCDLLAIKAVMKRGDVDRGRQIHQTLNAQHREQSLSLKATLIDFYGTFGDIEAAVAVFDSIDEKEKDVWIFGSMMEAMYCSLLCCNA